MKTHFFRLIMAAFMVSTFLFSACEKEDNQPGLSETLNGKWILASVSGGITGQGYTPTFNTLHFLDTDKYQLLNGDTLKAQGSYQIYKKEVEDWIKFIPSSASPLPFETQDKKVSTDKTQLTLSEPCCDMYEYHFNKASN